MAEGSVLVAWIDNGSDHGCAGTFASSLALTAAADAAGPQRIVGLYRARSGVNVSYPRCEVAKAFLDHPARPDWLFFVDADMGWTPAQFARLYDVADAEHRPIVSALCVGGGALPDGSLDTVITVFAFDEQRGPVRWHDVPDDTLARVDATGAAFLLIHRRVFEALHDRYAPSPFWAFRELEVGGHPTGEDTAFCIRAAACGFPTHVHTGITVDHVKGPLTLNLDVHRRVQRDSRTVVIVPVRDRLDLTSRMLNQLRDQGGADLILVFDNGSGTKTRNWLGSQQWLTVFDAKGASIHEMWNAGVDEALKFHPRTNVAILNNDLELGPRFLAGLAEGLRSDPRLVVVSPNYDGRTDHRRVIPTEGICAGRYDGTGGIAGFAFMVRGEWLRSTRYRFPSEARWWFGDTDLVLTVMAAGGGLGIVRDTTVVHVDGGSQTAKDHDLEAQIRADSDWFHAKWGAALTPAEVP